MSDDIQITIKITNRRTGRKPYLAVFGGDPKVCGSGQTACEAIGDLFRLHPNLLTAKEPDPCDT